MTSASSALIFLNNNKTISGVKFCVILSVDKFTTVFNSSLFHSKDIKPSRNLFKYLVG